MQKKPSEPTPHFDAEEDAKKVEKDSKRDPFAPPYNENLYIGEVIDEEEDAEYVVLVRLRKSFVIGLWQLTVPSFQYSSTSTQLLLTMFSLSPKVRHNC